MQCLEINSVKVFFDKEKTQKNITTYNEPCDCQDCRNYYKIIESNMELREFLSQFGIDYLRAEEVISYELRLNAKDSPIHSMAYYDVFGYIEKEFSIKKDDYTILFKKNTDVNVGHEVDDEYFWIVLDMVIPYMLEEEREVSNGSLFLKNNKYRFYRSVVDMSKKKLSRILLVAAVIVELIACVLWLVPIAGFIVYLFVCGFAIILSAASIILEKESKLVRILACILFSVLLISLIADGIFVVKFVCGLL